MRSIVAVHNGSIITTTINPLQCSSAALFDNMKRYQDISYCLDYHDMFEIELRDNSVVFVIDTQGICVAWKKYATHPSGYCLSLMQQSNYTPVGCLDDHTFSYYDLVSRQSSTTTDPSITATYYATQHGEILFLPSLTFGLADKNSKNLLQWWSLEGIKPTDPEIQSLGQKLLAQYQLTLAAIQGQTNPPTIPCITYL